MVPRTLTFFPPAVASDNEREALAVKAILSEAVFDEFKCVITLYSQNKEIDCQQWLGQRCALRMNVDGVLRDISGYILHIHKAHLPVLRSPDRYCYTLTLTSWFDCLIHDKNSRTFVGQSVVDIFRSVISAAFVATEWESHLSKPYPALDYKVQHQESTYHFLRRLLSENGIYYTFMPSLSEQRLCLWDAGSSKPAVFADYELTSQSASPFVSELTPHTGVSKTPYASGHSNILHLTPRHFMRLTPSANFLLLPDESDWKVLSVQHVVEDYTQLPSLPAGVTQDTSYSNTFTTQKADQSTVLPTLTKAHVRPESAQVVSTKESPLDTNAFGHIKVHYPWDRQTKADTPSTPFIPHAHALAGQNYGLQALPRRGDEMLINYLNDDIESPVALKSLPQQKHKPFMTPPSLGIQTAHLKGEGQHAMHWRQDREKTEFTLKTDGTLNMSAKKAFTQLTDGSYTTHTKGISSKNAHEISLLTPRLQLQVGQNAVRVEETGISIENGAHVYFEAEGVPGTFPIACVGDLHDCPEHDIDGKPHGKQPILENGRTYKIHGKAIACVGDKIACGATITKGAGTITLDGLPIAYVGSETDHGGKIISGAPDVFVSPRITQPVAVPTVDIPSMPKPPKMQLHVKTVGLQHQNTKAAIGANALALPSEGTVKHELAPTQLNKPVQLHFDEHLFELPDTLMNWPRYNEAEYRLYIKQTQVKEKIDLEPEHQMVMLEASGQHASPLNAGEYHVDSLSENHVNWLYGLTNTLVVEGMLLGTEIGKLVSTAEKRAFLHDFFHGGSFDIKEIKGIPYVIFSGSRKLRETIKGTRYRADNPKIKAIKVQALLRSGNLEGIKEAGKDSTLGVFIVGSIDVINYFNDKTHKQDLIDLFAKIFVDAGKVILATVLGGIAAVLFVPASAGAVVVIAAGIIFSFVIGYVLDKVDENLQITEELQKLIHKAQILLQKEYSYAQEWINAK